MTFKHSQSVVIGVFGIENTFYTTLIFLQTIFMTKNWVHCWTPSKKAEPTLKYFPNGSLHPPFWWILWPSRPLKSFFEEKILRMTIQSFLDSFGKYSNFQKKWYFGGSKSADFWYFQKFFKKCKKPKNRPFSIFSQNFGFSKKYFFKWKKA